MSNIPVMQPLWRQLQETSRVVQQVRAGVSGSLAIERVPLELRPGVQALAFHVWRNLGRAEALRNLLVKKVPPVASDALLCVALALLWNEEGGAAYEAFTLVNQTIEAAKRNATTRAQANFLNACLRRFLRERDVLVASTDSNPVAVWNHPLWWIDRLKTERPHDWQEILTASNNHAPMTLRLNVQKARGIDYLESLQRDGISADLGANGQIYLAKALPVQRVPGFQSGQVSVQDAAAQRAAPLLLGSWEGRTNLRILDACAAPGGKTGHLLEISHASVTALEVDAHRSKRITENLQRLGLFAEVKVGDASNPAGWWDGELFDAILLDAPCTASGIVRRHPDVRWLRREADIGQLALLQRKLLNTLWPLVKPGGRLLYCTCSVFAAEGVQQIETFLEHNTDTRLLPSPGHLLPRSGYKDGMPADNPMLDHDGFYYALLQKILP